MKPRKSYLTLLVLLLVAICLPLVAQVRKPVTSRKPRQAELSPAQVSFIRPGVKVKIVSASIAKDGTISARFTLTDPKGVPLDRDGIATPGTISNSLICAYIPAGQKE